MAHTENVRGNIPNINSILTNEHQNRTGTPPSSGSVVSWDGSLFLFRGKGQWENLGPVDDQPPDIDVPVLEIVPGVDVRGTQDRVLQIFLKVMYGLQHKQAVEFTNWLLTFFLPAIGWSLLEEREGESTKPLPGWITLHGGGPVSHFSPDLRNALRQISSEDFDGWIRYRRIHPGTGEESLVVVNGDRYDHLELTLKEEHHDDKSDSGSLGGDLGKEVHSP